MTELIFFQTRGTAWERESSVESHKAKIDDRREATECDEEQQEHNNKKQQRISQINKVREVREHCVSVF